MSPADDRAVGGLGGQFGDHSAVAIVGLNLPDVAREALKIAKVESQSRPVLLVDMLGQGSALGAMCVDDDPHGVSDSARYGLSLARVARPVPNADSLFMVPGGLETPLADDVLTDHLWGSWSEQCRRAGALLVVAAPADLPQVGRAIDQLDGVVMVGDAAVPSIHVPVIGRMRTSRHRVGDASARRITPEELAAARVPKPNLGRLALMVAGGAVAAVVVSVGVWYANDAIYNRRSATTPAGSPPIVMPGDPAAAPPIDARAVEVGAMPWSVEVVSVNSRNGAMARVRQALDSFPVPTFVASQPRAGSAIWYRFLAGAFANSADADWFLAALRGRGVLGPAAGRVVWAPLAWKLEEGVAEDDLDVRLFAWRQQGLPAYALIDAAGTTRIYFGAFENEAEARLLSPLLDSLNLHATLATRIGSIR